MWYKETVFYEIYLPSFNDSSGNGIGDLKGIVNKLDYLSTLGIGGIWITPFYKSPKVDNGYDIEDYYEIDEEYGCMDDFDRLIDEAHKRGIKVIIDLVLNHTSKKHKWFKESRKSLTSPYRDYYIWSKYIPNNWESFFSGSCWEYDNITKEYYYHAFSKEQVCLNWTNLNVKKEMFNVMKFWLNKGIDGIRFDVINFLKVNLESFKLNNPKNNSNKQEHIYDLNQDGVIEIIKEIVFFTRKWKDIFLLGEVGSEDLSTLKKYIGDDLLDAVLNFNIGSIDDIGAEKIAKILKETNNLIEFPTLFFTSHDTSRYISRLCNNNINLAKAVAGLMLFSKGIPFVYQGDEIGMIDYIAKSRNDIRDIRASLKYDIIYKNSKDKEEALNFANKMNRDKSRTPMQWDKDKVNYDFSIGNPWISNNGNSCDVVHQIVDETSIYSFYKSLISLRNSNKVMQYGDYDSIISIGDIILITRKYKDEKLLCIINFGNSQNKLIDKKGTLLISSHKISSKFIEPYEFSIYCL